LSVTISGWSTGEKALEWLSGGAAPPVVANVFLNSFYLKTGSSDLVNVTRKEVRSPVNINMEAGGPDFQKVIRVGERATFDSGVLSLGQVKLLLSDQVFKNSERPEGAGEQSILSLKDMLPAAAALLRAFNLPESILDADGRAFETYRSFVNAVFLPTSPFDEASFLGKGYGLLGLGSGFTPSFDDFMAGFLCTYNAGNALLKRSKLFVDAAEAQKKTSWASAKLLDYMQHGLMDEVVESVVSSFLRGDGDAYILSLQDVVARGHSSGLDMSVGIVLASATIFDLIDHGSLAAKLSKSMGF
jgi:hypothetical protein